MRSIKNSTAARTNLFINHTVVIDCFSPSSNWKFKFDFSFAFYVRRVNPFDVAFSSGMLLFYAFVTICPTFVCLRIVQLHIFVLHLTTSFVFFSFSFAVLRTN